MNRELALKKLQEEDFDLCIIGAGASGAGVAIDAASRGLKVALIDKKDFASETSSKSTKLIHGGVRYLEQAFKKLDLGQLKQVRHGLHERKFVLQNAPHLAKPQALLTPVFSWFEGLYYFIGLKIYGLFAINDQIPPAKWLSKKETLATLPDLKTNIHSSVLYYDGTFDDARYVLALVQTAQQHQACVANYVSFKEFVKNPEGQIKSAILNDEWTGKEINVKAKVFVNCTGPFADHVRLAADAEEEPRIRPSKGVHITFPKEYFRGDAALLIPETKDGRVVFLKPLEQEVAAGTTDTAYDALDKEPVLESHEIDYLLETMEPFLVKLPPRESIKAGFAGIRPLLAPKSSLRKETKSLLRDHEVEYSEKSGLVSLLGGKWTTYRLMAKDTVDFVSKLLGKENICSTESLKLYGAQQKDFDKITFDLKAKQMGLSPDTRHHLLEKYGDRADIILEIIVKDKSLAEPIVKPYPYVLAEAVYGIKHEMVCTFRDFIARRIRLEITDWQAATFAIDQLGEVFKDNLAWTSDELLMHKQHYLSELRRFMDATKI